MLDNRDWLDIQCILVLLGWFRSENVRIGGGITEYDADDDDDDDDADMSQNIMLTRTPPVISVAMTAVNKANLVCLSKLGKSLRSAFSHL